MNHVSGLSACTAGVDVTPGGDPPKRPGRGCERRCAGPAATRSGIPQRVHYATHQQGVRSGDSYRQADERMRLNRLNQRLDVRGEPGTWLTETSHAVPGQHRTTIDLDRPQLRDPTRLRGG